jgi:hypothetical protein
VADGRIYYKKTPTFNAKTYARQPKHDRAISSELWSPYLHGESVYESCGEWQVPDSERDCTYCAVCALIGHHSSAVKVYKSCGEWLRVRDCTAFS